MSDYQSTPQPAPYTGAAVPANERWNVLAIVGFVLAFVVSAGRRDLRAHRARPRSSAPARRAAASRSPAVILGYAGILFGIIAIIAYVGLIAAAVSSGAISTSP